MKFLLSVFLVFPVSAHAADYSHCVKYWNQSGSESLTNWFFRLDADGKINTSRMRPDVSKEKTTDGYKFKLNLGLNGAAVVTAKTTKDNRPTQVEMQFVFNEGTVVRDVTRTTFAVKNDVCYPQKLVVKDESDNDRDGFGFDMGLCRELVDYLAKNPEAKKCQCGTDKSSREITKILGKYKHLTSLPENSDKYVMEANAEQVQKMADQPLTRAFSEINRCRAFPGLQDAMGDKRLWGSNATNEGQGPDGHGSSTPAN